MVMIIILILVNRSKLSAIVYQKQYIDNYQWNSVKICHEGTDTISIAIKISISITTRKSLSHLKLIWNKTL